MALVYVIIGLIIVTVVGLILSLKKFDKLRERFGDIVAYTLTSAAAILLVLLSVYLPSHLTHIENVETTERLFANAQHDIYQTRQDVIMLYELMRMDTLDGHLAAGTIDRNGLSTPRIFLRLLGNQNILKSMNDEMLESSRRFESTMYKVQKWLSEDSLSDAYAFERVHRYGAELWKFEQVLELYLRHMEQGTSDSAFTTEKMAILRLHVALMTDSLTQSKYKKHPWLELGP